MTKHLLVARDNSRMRDDFERFYDVHPEFPNFVHACVTSPPYRKKDGYDTINIDEVALALEEFLMGPLWLNFGDLAGQMRRAPLTAMFFQDWGFEWVKTIIWHKTGHYTPLRGNRTFDTRHEYIYLLVPSHYMKDFELDRLADGIPFVDTANIKRFGHDGDVKCPGTVWPIKYGTIQKRSQKSHPFRFPVALPEKCLKHTVIPKNGWVIDPWGGSGTTMLAAKNLNINSVIYERDEKMIEVIRERIPEVEVIE